MNLYLRWAGAAVIMVAALYTSREYSRFASRRLAQWRGFISLLTHLEGEISKFLARGEGLFRGFADAELEECGFLQNLREGDGLLSAFEKCQSKLLLPRECKDALCEFFSSFGRSYKESELASLGAFRSSFEKEYEAEKERLEKSVKVTRTLLLGLALSVAILLI